MRPGTLRALWLHVGITPHLPHVRLADNKKGLRHELAPTRALLVLRERSLVGGGQWLASRVQEAEVIEVALERLDVGHLLAAGCLKPFV